MLKKFFALSVFFVVTFLFGVAGIVLAFVAPGSVTAFAVRPWGKISLRCFGVSLKIEGAQNVPSEPSVIMYNHQSSFDILALAACLPGDYKFVMKREVARLPFVGWLSKVAGHYFVSRDGGSADTRELKLMTRGIRDKKHTVVLAPEGTRSESGRLLDFKKGGFLLASLSGAPVVPMVIWGGKNLKRKNSPNLQTGGRMSARFFPPVHPKNFPPGRKGMEEIEQNVRNSMTSEIERRLRAEIF